MRLQTVGLSLILTMPLIVFADQQYMAAANSSSAAPYQSPTPGSVATNATNNSGQIYVSPTQNQANAAAPQTAPNSVPTYQTPNNNPPITYQSNPSYSSSQYYAQPQINSVNNAVNTATNPPSYNATTNTQASGTAPNNSYNVQTAPSNNTVANTPQTPVTGSTNAAVTNSVTAPQNATSPNTQQAAPNNQTAAQAYTQPNNASNAYTDAEKTAWFNSCVPAVSDNRVSAFAQEFCACGWQHITSGQLPASLLISTNPNDAQQRNTIMQVISQECVVQVMANHNLNQ